MPRAASRNTSRAGSAQISVSVDDEARKATVRVSPTKKKRVGTSKKLPVTTRADSDDAEDADARAKVEAAIHRQALLDNYDAEIQERRAAIEKHITYVLSGLRRECQSQLALLPDSVANITVGEFADVYAFSLDLASRGVARRRNEANQLDLPVDERIERGLASARKRKHADALPTPTLSQVDPGSPMPSRPAKRPTPQPIASTSKSGQLSRSTRSRAASPVSGKSQPSTHQGFVYRARPSLLANGDMPAKSPAVPMTPAGAQGRRPRRQESIQAFSLNGSPLGLLDVERDVDDDAVPGLDLGQPVVPPQVVSPPAPTGDFTFAVPLPASVVAELRLQLGKTVMAPEDRQKLQRILDGQA